MNYNLLFVFLLFFACTGERAAVPKPHAFPRVIYPERAYDTLSMGNCPFTFEYPAYGDISPRTQFFGEKPVHPCWFDISMQQLNARLHISYFPVKSPGHFDDLVSDAFTIAGKINQRSNFMDEIRVANEHGVSGLIMDFKGPAASPMHFFLTDSTQHFFKASLYFEAHPRPDSLAPVTAFIKEDLAHLINTFQWR